MVSYRSILLLAVVFIYGGNECSGCGIVDVSRCYAPLLLSRELSTYCRGLPEVRVCLRGLLNNERCRGYLKEAMEEIVQHLDGFASSARCRRYDGGSSRPRSLIRTDTRPSVSRRRTTTTTTKAPVVVDANRLVDNRGRERDDTRRRTYRTREEERADYERRLAEREERRREYYARRGSDDRYNARPTRSPTRSDTGDRRTVVDRRRYNVQLRDQQA